jgi:two-component system, OmpR family, response regulator PrrA
MFRVLIVDDQEDVRTLMVGLLSDTFDVATAEDGNLALQRIREHRFDAIVLDLEMPELDGAGFMRALRAHGWRCPVLVCSGHVEVERQAKEIGATDWIAKPFASEALGMKLHSLLGAQRTTELRPSGSEPRSEAQETPVRVAADGIPVPS